LAKKTFLSAPMGRRVHFYMMPEDLPELGDLVSAAVGRSSPPLGNGLAQLKGEKRCRRLGGCQRSF
jgi:hypothetical protein